MIETIDNSVQFAATLVCCAISAALHFKRRSAEHWRYAQSKGYDVSASADLTGFLDYGQISEYALPALQWAVGAGVMSGRGDGILAPQGTATRAEAAAMLMRFAENVK